MDKKSSLKSIDHIRRMIRPGNPLTIPECISLVASLDDIEIVVKQYESEINRLQYRLSRSRQCYAPATERDDG